MSARTCSCSVKSQQSLTVCSSLVRGNVLKTAIFVLKEKKFIRLENGSFYLFNLLISWWKLIFYGQFKG